MGPESCLWFKLKGVRVGPGEIAQQRRGMLIVLAEGQVQFPALKSGGSQGDMRALWLVPSPVLMQIPTCPLIFIRLQTYLMSGSKRRFWADDEGSQRVHLKSGHLMFVFIACSVAKPKQGSGARTIEPQSHSVAFQQSQGLMCRW